MLLLFQMSQELYNDFFSFDNKKSLDCCLDILSVRLSVRIRTMWHEIAHGKKTVKRSCHPCILLCEIKSIIKNIYLR